MPLHKHITLLFVMLLAAGLARAQQPDTASGNAANGYRDRYIQLNKYYSQHPDDIPTLALLAKFYADSLNPMYNLPLAMEHILDAESRYMALASSSSSDAYREMRQLLKMNVNISTLRSVRNGIVIQARKRITNSFMLDDVELERYEAVFESDTVVGQALKRQRMEYAKKEARTLNTMDGYYNFELRYKGTQAADSAEYWLGQLARRRFDAIESSDEAKALANKYKESESVQNEAKKCLSRIAFAVACTGHTVEAYKNFMKEYPYSEEYLLALGRINNLLAEKYGTLKSASDYAQFIIENSDDDLADDAMEVLRDKIKKEQNIEAAKIYLENFPLDEDFNEIFKLYYRWHASEGNLQPIADFARQFPDYPFQMALNADLKEARSIDSTKLMRPYSDNMRETYVSYIRHHTGKKIVFPALQRIIQPYVARKDWDGALEQLGWVCLSFEDVCSQEYNQLKTIIQTAPDSRTQLQNEFQTTFNINKPVPHPGGKELYYTLKENGSNTICYAIYDTDHNQWRNAGPVIFTNAANADMTIYCFFERGQKMLLGSQGDIWIAKREGSQWRVTDIPPYPVNTDDYEGDAYMLPDGTGMLVCSDRPGGYNLQKSGAYYHGDTAKATDIYFVPNTLNGWGKPVNLGPQINTQYCEASPLLSRDLKTLYFVTDGRGGLGYGDVYVARRTASDDWTHWSEPKNLGREANSSLQENWIRFNSNEQRLYIGSNRQGNRFACYSCGTIHDGNDFLQTVSIDASRLGHNLTSIELADISLQALSTQLSYPNTDKPILIDLYRGKRYMLYAHAAGLYIPVQMIDPQQTRNILLQGYNPDQVCRKNQLQLPSVSFRTDTPDINSISTTELNTLADFLINSPLLRIELTVNVRGQNSQNAYNLSVERAQSLRRYLVSQGVEGNRITISAYGNANYKKSGTKPPCEVLVRFTR